MVSDEPQDLGDYLAEDVRNQADELVEEWISWVLERAALRPVHMLPREAIRNHIPGVLRGVAEALRGPVDTVSPAVDDALRSHAHLRHDQGFDVEELLQEYEGLEAIVSEHILENLEDYPGSANPAEVGRIFVRLSAALFAMTRVTVSVYRQIEVDHKRELHQHLKDYIQTITHELKQPLNAITAGAGMLEEEDIASEEKDRERYVQIIRTGIDRAVGLIEDIRILALVEGAERQEQWEPLEKAVNLAVRELQEQAREHDVRVEVQRPFPSVEVDSTPVEIALVNLLANAIKYSDPDEDERWARIEVERVDPDDAQNHWEIRVQDNGLGIPDHARAQVLERHFRAHPEISEGTGLGLAIARQVVEQAGGRIWFESEDGKGSTFHFTVSGHLVEGETRPSEGSDGG